MFLLKSKYQKIGYLLLFLFLVWPSRFAVFRYENIAGEDIYDNLIKKTSKNLSLFHDKGVQCVSWVDSGCEQVGSEWKRVGSGQKQVSEVTQIPPANRRRFGKTFNEHICPSLAGAA